MHASLSPCLRIVIHGTVGISRPDCNYNYHYYSAFFRSYYSAFHLSLYLPRLIAPLRILGAVFLFAAKSRLKKAALSARKTSLAKQKFTTCKFGILSPPQYQRYTKTRAQILTPKWGNKRNCVLNDFMETYISYVTYSLVESNWSSYQGYKMYQKESSLDSIGSQTIFLLHQS